MAVQVYSATNSGGEQHILNSQTVAFICRLQLNLHFRYFSGKYV